jgi:predicted acylesterase/phospholipase RssA
VDRSIVETIAEIASEDRLLLIGATNLDIGTGRAFDLGHEARQALRGDDFSRIHSILFASSSIPGAFPPVEMDGMYYADGGAAANLFVASFPGPDGPLARFKARNPDAPLPTTRVWIVVNQQLRPQLAITRPRWISISGRALNTLTSTAQLFALTTIGEMIEDATIEHGLDAELYFVSIPMDAPKKESKEMFDQDYMRALQDLGRTMGADPSSWQNEVTSPYEAEFDWLEAR